MFLFTESNRQLRYASLLILSWETWPRTEELKGKRSKYQRSNLFTLAKSVDKTKHSFPLPHQHNTTQFFLETILLIYLASESKSKAHCRPYIVQLLEEGRSTLWPVVTYSWYLHLIKPVLIWNLFHFTCDTSGESKFIAALPRQRIANLIHLQNKANGVKQHFYWLKNQTTPIEVIARKAKHS